MNYGTVWMNEFTVVYSYFTMIYNYIYCDKRLWPQHQLLTSTIIILCTTKLQAHNYRKNVKELQSRSAK